MDGLFRYAELPSQNFHHLELAETTLAAAHAGSGAPLDAFNRFRAQPLVNRRDDFAFRHGLTPAHNAPIGRVFPNQRVLFFKAHPIKIRRRLPIPLIARPGLEFKIRIGQKIPHVFGNGRRRRSPRRLDPCRMNKMRQGRRRGNPKIVAIIQGDRALPGKSADHTAILKLRNQMMSPC